MQHVGNLNPRKRSDWPMNAELYRAEIRAINDRLHKLVSDVLQEAVRMFGPVEGTKYMRTRSFALGWPHTSATDSHPRGSTRQVTTNARERRAAVRIGARTAARCLSLKGSTADFSHCELLAIIREK